MKTMNYMAQKLTEIQLCQIGDWWVLQKVGHSKL